MIPDVLTFFRRANFILLLDSVAMNAFLAACSADICKAMSGNVDFSCAGNLWSIMFGKFVFLPKTNWDGLKPLLLIKEFLAHKAHERAVS